MARVRKGKKKCCRHSSRKTHTCARTHTHDTFEKLAPDKIPGQFEGFVELGGVGGVGDEVFHNILEMAFEKHPLPRVAVGADVANVPSAHAASPPISLVRYKIGGDLVMRRWGCDRGCYWRRFEMRVCGRGCCWRRDGGVIEIVVGRGAGVSMCDSVLLATGGE